VRLITSQSGSGGCPYSVLKLRVLWIMRPGHRWNRWSKVSFSSSQSLQSPWFFMSTSTWCRLLKSCPVRALMALLYWFRGSARRALAHLGSGLGKKIRVCRASGPFSHLCVQMFCISVCMCHLATARESGVIGSHP
jgi:hypothetical protein